MEMEKMVEKNAKATGDDWLYQQLAEKESIINGISDPLMVLDTRNYQILNVNEAFLSSYKITSDEALGKTCYEVTHHRNSPCAQAPEAEPCPLEQSVLRKGLVQTDHVHEDREGNRLHFEITAYPLKNADGEVSRIVHLSRDVTDRRRAEEALKERVTKSEHLAALGRLVAEITHEIKNPLLMIGGFSKQLLKPVDEATKIKKLTIITEEVARLERLLKDLMEYYVPRAHDFEAVNVKEVLEKVYYLVKDECAKNNIKIEMILDKADLTVKWDPNKLKQVFLNVIKNSIEAIESEGKISIRARPVIDEVEITIADDGCGIPGIHMDRITECFFTTKRYGTGLGLCNIKKYIDEHEGSFFSVESKEGEGTIFRITLPSIAVSHPTTQ